MTVNNCWNSLTLLNKLQNNQRVRLKPANIFLEANFISKLSFFYYMILYYFTLKKFDINRPVVSIFVLPSYPLYDKRSRILSVSGKNLPDNTDIIIQIMSDIGADTDSYNKRIRLLILQYLL